MTREILLNTKPQSKIFTISGCDYEIRPVTIARKTELRTMHNDVKYIATIFIESCYVNGKRVFQDTDLEAIINAPSGSPLEALVHKSLLVHDMPDIEKKKRSLEKNSERFLIFRIAELLHMSAAELEQKMSNYELFEWVAYLEIKNNLQQKQLKNCNNSSKKPFKKYSL